MNAVDRTAFELAISVTALKEQLSNKSLYGTNRAGERITAVTIDDLKRVIDYFDTQDITEVKKIAHT